MNVKIGGFESLNFDFCVVNFDTMKLIFYSVVSKALMPQGFSNIEKERKLQYLWYHNFRSYLNADYNLDMTANAVQKAVHTGTLNFWLYLITFITIHYKLLTKPFLRYNDQQMQQRLLLSRNAL